MRPPQPPQFQPPRPLAFLRGVSARDHPSLARPFEAPKAEWTADQIADRFESGLHLWLDDGTRPIVNEEGELGRPVPYWRAVREIAAEIFGRSVRPGLDYALTEIVRCKSTKEIGVPSAARECAPRYLERTLALSPAPLIVVLGRKAHQAVRILFRYPDAGIVSRELEIAGMPRRLVFLAHPNAREGGRAKPLKYPKRLSGRDLGTARESLDEELRGQKFRWEADDIRITHTPEP